MAILLIADLHLNEENPMITAGFLRFLQEQASQAKALYILGDFFDYWIGDDDPSLLHEVIAEKLKELENKGIPCYFIHGNRDFLLNKEFAKKSGMILLPSEKVLTLYGLNILILHGDTLCTNNISYQRYRKQVYNNWLKRFFLILPLFTRHFIAKYIRKNSQFIRKYNKKRIIDVNEQTVIDKFKKYQVDWIIHGHTHQPAIHKINVNTKILSRAVLGAWYKNGSTIKITSEDGIKLIYFPFH
ncbi:MAG: UDP-2,3-diacylglucosamine diphosphatase [Arsenophonus sp.]